MPRPIALFVAFASIAIMLSLSAGPSAGQDSFAAAAQAYRDGDYAKALSLWQPLAESGNRAAQYNLGRMHATGQGVEQNIGVAYSWMLVASRNGQVEALQALNNLGTQLSAEEKRAAIRRADEWKKQQSR